MIVAHNPGLAELAVVLAGRGDRYELARLNQEFPTTSLALIDFDVERWKEARPQEGELDRFVTPASLADEKG
jgi:phosphohistidine phosphatase